jgi:hypothetical protein
MLRDGKSRHARDADSANNLSWLSKLREQRVESRTYCGGDQFAVPEGLPSAIFRCVALYLMAAQ